AAVADADGRYEVRDVDPGEVAVYAAGRGRFVRDFARVRPRGWNPYVVPVPAGGDVVRDLVVVPAASAKGRVHDEAGRPVEGARVLANPAQRLGTLMWSSDPVQ